jgi:rhamnose transport system substrate-binding protein
MRDFVKDGTVTAFQLWSPYNEGWLAAHFAAGVKGGTIKNEVGATFEVPNLGTITINPNNSINTQSALTTFDAANIDKFNF